MTETLDKKALMKCLGCGYIEEVEESMLEKTRWAQLDNDEDHILCPFCLNDMYRITSLKFKNKQ